MKYGGFEHEIYAGYGWKDFVSVYGRWLLNGSHGGGNDCRGSLSLVDNNDLENLTANTGLGGSSVFCSSFPGGRRTLAFALARFIGRPSLSEPSRSLTRSLMSAKAPTSLNGRSAF